MKGYKAFKRDMTCLGFQYEIGKSYEMDDCELCDHGFHFCRDIADCFTYYPNGNSRFAEVEAYGEIVECDLDSKCVTNKIRIVKEIPREEALAMVNIGHNNSGHSNTGNNNSGHSNTGSWNTGGRNTGSWNTGGRNTGDRNTGYRNTGDGNIGYWNTGNGNTGNWNTGDLNTGNGNTGNWNTGDLNIGNGNTGDWNTTERSTGCFCTKKQTILMFDEPSELTYEDWYYSDAARILRNMPLDIDEVEWIDTGEMTDEEKTVYPEYETTGGYLKNVKKKADRQKWWDELDEEEKSIVKSIPNFDAEKFYACTGVRV